jgi:hypothetical protein
VLIRLPTSSAETLTVEISPQALLAAPSRAASPAGPREIVLTALAAPIGYPPLRHAILPGDHVTIAVDPELPGLVEVVFTLLEGIVADEGDPANIVVLVSQPEQQRRLTSSLPPAWREVQIVLHDPRDESAHAYLAATREGHPLYLNRAIGDADVFIPVGVQRLDDRGSLHGSWYPTFSSADTQHRLRSPNKQQPLAPFRHQAQETKEAAWLLGVRLVVQVLPGPGGSVAAAWCGDADEVSPVAARACREQWLTEIDQPADLVIAILDAESGEQSWQQIARILPMAARVIRSDGAIVVWTDLATPPSAALTALVQSAADDEHPVHGRSADAVAAQAIGDAVQQCRVYLHSQLDDAVVEDLGLATLHTAAELQRLVSQAASCLVIESAQYASVQLRQSVEA